MKDLSKLSPEEAFIEKKKIEAILNLAGKEL